MENSNNLSNWIKQQQHVLNELPKPNRGEFDPNGCDDPKEFLKLEPEQQTELVAWILNTLARGKSINYMDDSYSLKHLFYNSPSGMYVNNGAFKGAMIICKFDIADKRLRNWNFNIKRSSINNAYKVSQFMQENGIINPTS